MTALKAISIRQPWMFAILGGWKTVENRSHNVRHRGPILLHTSLTVASQASYPARHPSGYAAAQALDAAGGRANLWDARDTWPARRPAWARAELACGAIVGAAEITGCHLDDGDCCAPWAQRSTLQQPSGRWRWTYHVQLANVRTLTEPVYCPGSVTIPWNVPPAIAARVTAALPDVAA